MTPEQFLLILGTIYIARVVDPIFCYVMGWGFAIAAVCKGLGLI